MRTLNVTFRLTEKQMESLKEGIKIAAAVLKPSDNLKARYLLDIKSSLEYQIAKAEFKNPPPNFHPRG